MKVFDLVIACKSNEIETVVCQSDGDIKYCNSLAVNGTCISKNVVCPLAVVAIVERNGFIKEYLAIEH